jgi:hypothetical protein
MKENTRAKIRLIPSARKEKLKNPVPKTPRLSLITSPSIMEGSRKRRKTKEKETIMTDQTPLILPGNTRQNSEPIKGTRILSER